MAGNQTSNRESAATRLGISIAEYEHHIHLGEKWCCKCKKWELKSFFGIDNSRCDGLATSCLTSRKKDLKKRYERLPDRFRVPTDLEGYIWAIARSFYHHLIEHHFEDVKSEVDLILHCLINNLTKKYKVRRIVNKELYRMSVEYGWKKRNSHWELAEILEGELDENV